MLLADMFTRFTVSFKKAHRVRQILFKGEGVQIPWIGRGGLNQPPPLEINEGVVSDPRLLYRSLT